MHFSALFLLMRGLVCSSLDVVCLPLKYFSTTQVLQYNPIPYLPHLLSYLPMYARIPRVFTFFFGSMHTS